MGLKQKGHTRESMVSASLHVERGKVQGQFTGEFKQPVPQLFVHHGVLCVQLGLATHQPPQDWVQTTFGALETLSVIHEYLT